MNNDAAAFRLNDQPFLKGGGETGQLLRSLDWSKHLLGNPCVWHDTLKHSISMMLTSPLPVAVNWGHEFIYFYNDHFLPLMGRDKHPHSMGQKVIDVYHEIWDMVKPLHDRVMNGETVGFKDMLIPLNRNGKLEDAWFDFTYSPIHDLSGTVQGMLVISAETTDKIKNERNFEESATELQAINEELITSNNELEQTQRDLEKILNSLKESEQQVRSLVDSAPFPIGVYVGKEMRIMMANQSILDAWGKGNNVIGKLYSEILPELNNQQIFDQLDHVFTTGIPLHMRNQRVDIVMNGILKTYFFNYSFTPLFDSEGQIYGVMNTAAEVTDLNIAKQKIEQNEKNLRNIILQAPVAMSIMLGPEHIITVANQLMIELLGKREEDIINKPVFDALPDLAGQGFEAVLNACYKNGKTFKAFEQPVSLIRDGIAEIVYQNFVFEPYHDSDGTILGIISITIDVTEQVLARKKVEESAAQLSLLNEEITTANEQYHLAISTANLGTWSADLKTDMLTVSGRARRMHGLAYNQPISLTESLQLVLPEYRDYLINIINDSKENNAGFEVEYQMQPLDGSPVKWLRSTGKVYYDADGNRNNITGTILDITERKLDELRKNDFISMVSHELKTPLTSLSAIVQIAQEKLKDDEDPFLNGAMAKAYSQVKRMTNLINGFLNVSRLESGKIHLDKTSFDIVQLAHEIIDDAKLTSGAQTIELIADDKMMLTADREKISSVITNLLGNALKYSPRDSKKRIGLANKENHKLLVSVTDQGQGIHKDDRNKIFERYYRSEKSKSKMISGFGIGLYLSAEIIDRHEGEIWVESEDGKGSTFYFELPLE
jgi:PAS domain S-box-containing protein